MSFLLSPAATTSGSAAPTKSAAATREPTIAVHHRTLTTLINTPECATTHRAADISVAHAIAAGWFEVTLSDLARCTATLSKVALAGAKRISTLAQISLSRMQTIAAPRALAGIEVSRTLGEIAFVQSLLDLARTWARVCDISASSVEPIRHIPVVVGHATPMGWIVYPGIAVAGDIHSTKVIVVDEIVIDHHIVIAPSGIPAPTTPAT
jgi:hypothetical protein